MLLRKLYHVKRNCGGQVTMDSSPAFAAGRQGMAAFIKQSSPLGYLTSRFWSPSALWTIDLVIVLTGLGFVTAAVNAAIRNVAVIRAFRTEFYEEFRLWRHLLIPGAAALLFLFPLWGSCGRPPTR
jgi:hypothetical protein